MTLNSTLSQTLLNNKTPSNPDSFKKSFDLVIAYLSLSIIILGLIGNMACFCIFRCNKQMRKMSTNVYLSYCSITDTLSLFVWNLDHFLIPLTNIEMEAISLFACRLLSFIQYVSLQASAWLLSFMCIDRFVTVVSIPGSFVSRLPFSSTKSAHIWSVLILVVLSFVDLHVLILNGYISSAKYKNTTILTNNTNLTVLVLTQKPTVRCYAYSPEYSLSYWERIHLFIYSFVPFLVMFVFNSMLVYRVIRVKRAKREVLPSSTHEKKKDTSSSNRGGNKLTFSLLVITISFIVMTFPGSVLYGYFELNTGTIRYSFIKFSDFLGFVNRASLFFNCFMTNLKFRSIVLDRLFWKRGVNGNNEQQP